MSSSSSWYPFSSARGSSRARDFLDFPDSAEAAAEYERLRNLKFDQMRPLSLEIVETIRHGDRVRGMLTGPWLEVLTMSELTYTQLTLEFYSSYTFDENRCRNMNSAEQGPRFRLGGEWYQLSIRRLGEELGIFSPEELETYAVHGRTSLTTAEETEFWSSNTVDGTGVYLSRRSKATSFRNPLHRLLHRAIVGTIAHRSKASHGGLPHRDMLYLFSIVRQVPVNLAFCLAAYFGSSIRTKASPICGGGFITRIARSLGVLPANIPRSWKSVEVNVLDMRAFIKMNLVTSTAGGMQFLDGNGQIWAPPEPEDEDVEDEDDEDEDVDEDAAATSARNSPVYERAMSPPASPPFRPAPPPFRPAPPPFHPEPSFGGYQGARHSTSGYLMPDFQHLRIESPLPEHSYNPDTGASDDYTRDATLAHIRRTTDLSWEAIQAIRGDVQTMRGDIQQLREEQLRQREYHEQNQRNYEYQHNRQDREADWLHEMGTDILARFGYAPPPYHNLRDPQPGQRRQRHD